MKNENNIISLSRDTWAYGNPINPFAIIKRVKPYWVVTVNGYAPICFTTFSECLTFIHNLYT